MAKDTRTSSRRRLTANVTNEGVIEEALFLKYHGIFDRKRLGACFEVVCVLLTNGRGNAVVLSTERAG